MSNFVELLENDGIINIGDDNILAKIKNMRVFKYIDITKTKKKIVNKQEIVAKKNKKKN